MKEIAKQNPSGNSIDDTLREIVREEVAAAVATAFAEFAPAAKPALLDSEGIALEVGVSSVHVRKLSTRKVNPMPHHFVGDCRRYFLSEVADWIKSGAGASSKEEAK